ncbi:hypothetical protein ACQY0O_006324 [Thecaphora frezii]
MIDCTDQGVAGLQAAPALDDGSGSSTVEPPDSDQSVLIGLSKLSVSPKDVRSRPSGLTAGPSLPTPIHGLRTVDKTHQGTASTFGHHSASFGSRFARHPTLLASASIESHSSFDTHSSVPPSPSMSEGLTDSPSSVSSMNSFRRGDLADIEDLDLEPELETVSECDEESSSLCSTDIVGEMDSDSERASNLGQDNDRGALGLATSSSLGRSGTLKALASGSPASDYARRKRSEWYLNSYANKIAYRRPRKHKVGRVAELLEEGGGDIQTTVMPKPAHAPAAAEWTCEVSGPPAPALRSVSPSDTVPAVPSPLCVCTNADAHQGVSGSGSAAGMDESVETVKAPSVPERGPTQDVGDGDETAAAASASASATEADAHPQVTVPSPASSPKSESRPRRDSSPPKLRPCFRRRSSNQSAASTRESSCERESVRGRSVRFSPAPPLELRTHSPVEYDRKSCPVNTRLSPEDVEELRMMKMEMGLLEAKWAADAACKAPVPDSDAYEGDRAPSDAAFNAGRAALSAAAHRSSIDAGDGKSDSPHMTTAARIRLQKEREREKERQRQLPRPRIPRPQHDCDSIRAKFGKAPPPPLPGMPASCPTSSRSSSAPPVSRTPSEERAFQARLLGVDAPSPAMFERRTSVIPTLTQTGPSPPGSPLEVGGGNASKTGDVWRNPAVSAASGNRLGVLHGCGSNVRGRQPGPAASTVAASTTSSSCASSLRPANMLVSWTPPSSNPSPTAPAYPGANLYGGYDSPASGEFYESGSEYDLIG